MGTQKKGLSVLKNKYLFIFIVMLGFIQTIGADTNAIVKDRNQSTSDSMVYGDRSSDIPISGTIDRFQPQSIDVMSNIDASAHPDAKVYVGYGIYDEKEENCIYIDAKPSDGVDIKNAFSDFFVFNGHAYGISRTPMSHAQCQSQSAKYYGYPAMVTTDEENRALGATYQGRSFWLSTSRVSCGEPYRDNLGREQTYFSWSNNNEPSCDTSKLKLAKNSGTLSWSAALGSESKYCVVEFDTPDYNAPVKTCAPWWTIERTFKAPDRNIYIIKGKDQNGTDIEFDIRTINQRDFPMSVEVCSEIDQNTSTQANGTTTVVCNSYYDIRRSPRCVENIKQDVCKVNECRGTVENRCQQIDVMDAPLPYAKMSIISNGQEKIVKGKDDIKMHKYQCPALTKNTGCLKTTTVSMLPQVCPGTDVDENGTATKPTKVYGDPSIPGKYENGVLVALYGKCPNSPNIEIPVNVLRQESKTCKKYDMVYTEKKRQEKCQINRSSSDITVNTSISEVDTYENNESCVRLNDLVDARPHQDVLIDYETKGFANIDITKGQIAGEQTNVSPLQIISNYYSKAIAGGAYKDKDYEFQTATPTTSPASQDECSEYRDTPFFSDYLKSVVENGATQVYDYSAGNLIEFGNLTKTQCQNKLQYYQGGTILWGVADGNATIINSKNNQYENSYQLISKTGYSSTNLIQTTALSNETEKCIIALALAPASGDVFDKITIAQPASIDNPDIQLKTINSYSYEGCRRLAACSRSDVQNANHYNGSEICILHKSATSGQLAIDEINAEAPPPTPPPTVETTAVSDLAASSATGEIPIQGVDGLTDVFAISEYTDFDWGYYTSYSSRNYQSNIVKVNNLIVNPIIPHPMIQEQIYENYHWIGETHRNRDLPKVVKISAGVGASGGVDGYSGLTLGAIGAGFTGLALTYNAFKHDDIVSFKILSESEVYNKYNSSEYRYTPNANPLYETRKVDDNKLGEKSIIYNEFTMGTNDLMETKHAPRFFQSLRDSKTTMYSELNIDMQNYIWPQYERALPVADPDSCRWYNPWCKKSRHGSDGWKLLTPTTQYHKRLINTHYFGATNSVTIVVPYLGDYEVEGYDKHGELIGKSKVFASSFVDGASKMRYSQVKLAGSMALAPGLTGGDPCLHDSSVEIGGGVQGAVYEFGDTGTYNGFKCGRGNYDYTKEHAIVKLTIKAVNAEKAFTIVLPKPLPYPNRIFIGTMGLYETREYRCYDAFDECTDFKTAPSVTP